MKFAKRLEAEAVAEWRPKYLQYKQLKKLINVIVSSRSTTTTPIMIDMEKGQTSSELSSDEVLFFERFDADVLKINEFYKAREKEAIEKKAKILVQLHVLPDDKGTSSSSKKSPISQTENPASVMTWRSLDSRLGEVSAGSGDEAQMTIRSVTNRSNPERAKISSLRMSSFTHLARMRIKKALLEYYRSLELIRNFKTLNVLGCSKILKKFDKNTGRKVMGKYLEKLRSYEFFASEIIDGLMTDVENIYRYVFTDGDRAKALRKLRIKDLKRETFHSSAWFSGLLLGTCAALVWHLFSLVVNFSSPNKAKVLATQYLGLMYFAFGLVFAMAWLFAINAMVWEKYYINYRFILEFNQRNNLHICQYSTVAGIFTLLYLTLVKISLEGYMNEWIRPFLQPWIVFGILILILLCPINQFYRSSRIWFARVLMRISTAPFYPCRFKDFFINDQYMSLGCAFEMFGMLIYFTFNPKDNHVKDFSTVSTWYIILLQLLPGTWRSLQCLRRYHDSKMAFPHLANLAKYMCSLLVVVLAGVFKMYNCTKFSVFWYLVIASRVIASTFSLGWDIVMDFGLWQRSAVNDRLRNTILFRPWIYWYLIASDTIARYLWVLPYLQPQLFPGFQTVILTMILWTIEMLRRFQWNFFRVEYEHVNNCNVLRAVADVPLPFTATDLFYQDMVETIEKQRQEEPCLDKPTSQTSDGLLSPCSSGAEELDDDEYSDSVTYKAPPADMVQKSAHQPESVTAVFDDKADVRSSSPAEMSSFKDSDMAESFRRNVRQLSPTTGTSPKESGWASRSRKE